MYCVKGHSNNTWQSMGVGWGLPKCHTNFFNSDYIGLRRKRSPINKKLDFFAVQSLKVFKNKWFYINYVTYHSRVEGTRKVLEKVTRIIWISPQHRIFFFFFLNWEIAHFFSYLQFDNAFNFLTCYSKKKNEWNSISKNKIANWKSWVKVYCHLSIQAST